MCSSCGHALPDLEQLVDLLLVFDDGEARCRRCRARRPSRSRPRPGTAAPARRPGLRRHHRPIQLRAVVADDRQIVAAPKPSAARPHASARTSAATWPRSRFARCRASFSRMHVAPPRARAARAAASERCRQHRLRYASHSLGKRLSLLCCCVFAGLAGCSAARLEPAAWQWYTPFRAGYRCA